MGILSRSLSLSLFFSPFFNPLPSIFHCVLVSLATSEVIAVARHALPVMAFRHSIKRVSAYRRRERRLSFIVEIPIRCRFPLRRFAVNDLPRNAASAKFSAEARQITIGGTVQAVEEREEEGWNLDPPVAGRLFSRAAY